MVSLLSPPVIRRGPQSSGSHGQEAVHCGLPGCRVNLPWGALHEADAGDEWPGGQVQEHSDRAGQDFNLTGTTTTTT